MPRSLALFFSYMLSRLSPSLWDRWYSPSAKIRAVGSIAAAAADVIGVFVASVVHGAERGNQFPQPDEDVVIIFCCIEEAEAQPAVSLCNRRRKRRIIVNNDGDELKSSFVSSACALICLGHDSSSLPTTSAVAILFGESNGFLGNTVVGVAPPLIAATSSLLNGSLSAATCRPWGGFLIIGHSVFFRNGGV